ncbi:MAG: M23 family metallopeptidase [Acidobacteria bacterium]|nr:M23 family metallopeptidase [Acidobacteriota bacterium]
MSWFALWQPLFLQLAVPLALLAAVAFGRLARVTRLALATLTGLVVAAAGLAGVWLTLPYWLTNLYVAALLAGLLRQWRRDGPAAPPASARGWLALVAMAVPALLAAVAVARAIEAREPPADVMELQFPLGPGSYLVVNGGSDALVNAHVTTRTAGRFRDYRGQSDGVDLVRLNRAGLRASGWQPADPGAYAIFGTPVRAPCSGRVVTATDGLPDMSPPAVDRAHLAGNHVILDCAGTWVVLAHLARGSVGVRAGQDVAVLAPLGRAGNSGHTTEPHLHVHAQRPGTAAAPFGGAPVPIAMDGAYLVRNDRVTTK